MNIEYKPFRISKFVIVKISLSDLFNYFSISGDSKQNKNFPQKRWYFDHNWGGGEVGHFVVGTTQKYHFFWRRPSLTKKYLQTKYTSIKIKFFMSLSL